MTTLATLTAARDTARRSIKKLQDDGHYIEAEAEQARLHSLDAAIDAEQARLRALDDAIDREQSELAALEASGNAVADNPVERN
jgi:hypothetical protein